MSTIKQWTPRKDAVVEVGEVNAPTVTCANTRTQAKKNRLDDGFIVLAERSGFEPEVGLPYTRFPGVRLKPLIHLSTRGAL